MPVKSRLEGRWRERANYPGVGLPGRTLGIIGLGGIGRELARLMQPYGMTILAADPHVGSAAAADVGVELCGLEEVVTRSDFVVVACLLNNEARHLLNPTRLALMKPTAYLINVARGPIVDEEALIAALREELIGLDAEPGVGAESRFEQGFTGSHLRLVNLLGAELIFGNARLVAEVPSRVEFQACCVPSSVRPRMPLRPVHRTARPLPLVCPSAAHRARREAFPRGSTIHEIKLDGFRKVNRQKLEPVLWLARLWFPFENPRLGSPVGFLVGGHDIGQAPEFLSFRKRLQHLKRILASAIVSGSHEQVLLGRGELSSLEVMGRVCG
jgi:D-isomer specific 2-hydroxyacid dehydrogenase, NAD binding domain